MKQIENRKSKIVNQEYVHLIFENEPMAAYRFRWAWPLALFHLPEYIVQNQCKKICTFLLTDSEKINAYGIIHFEIKASDDIALSDVVANMAASISRASFGSFDLAEHIGYEAFKEWFLSIEYYLRSIGITDIRLTHYPEIYQPSRGVFVKRALLRNDFYIHKQLETSVLRINKNDFKSNLHTSERRRLAKCQRAGFVFEHWQNADAKIVFDFIEKSRSAQGYSLSFRLLDLQKWLYHFPENYLIFCVRDGQKIASLTIAVIVQNQVLYNFFPTDNLAYRTYSPAVMLNAGLYEYGQQNNFHTLDLGISVDAEGHFKPSLQQFKKRLGAVGCDKVWFQKKLSNFVE